MSDWYSVSHLIDLPLISRSACDFPAPAMIQLIVQDTAARRADAVRKPLVSSVGADGQVLPAAHTGARPMSGPLREAAGGLLLPHSLTPGDKATAKREKKLLRRAADRKAAAAEAARLSKNAIPRGYHPPDPKGPTDEGKYMPKSRNGPIQRSAEAWLPMKTREDWLRRGISVAKVNHHEKTAVDRHYQVEASHLKQTALQRNLVEERLLGGARRPSFWPQVILGMRLHSADYRRVPPKLRYRSRNEAQGCVRSLRRAVFCRELGS